jgi:hypothetical protein
MREKGWSRPFDDPIDLPGGRKLVTLEDAGNYITKLPKAEHSAPEWQDAMRILIYVATRGWPTMLARIGVLRALHRNEERVFNPDRKETHRGKRKLKRDQCPPNAVSKAAQRRGLLVLAPFHPAKPR